nr:hypothetical protein [Pseudomonas protegens]
MSLITPTVLIGAPAADVHRPRGQGLGGGRSGGKGGELDGVWHLLQLTGGLQ